MKHLRTLNAALCLLYSTVLASMDYTLFNALVFFNPCNISNSQKYSTPIALSPSGHEVLVGCSNTGQIAALRRTEDGLKPSWTRDACSHGKSKAADFVTSSISFNPAGDMIAITCETGSLVTIEISSKWGDFKNGALSSYTPCKGWWGSVHNINQATWSPAGGLLLVACAENGGEGYMVTYQHQQAKLSNPITTNIGVACRPLSAISHSPDGKRILAGCATAQGDFKTTVTQFDVAADGRPFNETSQFMEASCSAVNAMVWRPDAKQVIIGCEGESTSSPALTLSIFEHNYGRLLGAAVYDICNNAAVTSALYSPSGLEALIACASDIHLFTANETALESGRPSWKSHAAFPACEGSTVTSVAFAPGEGFYEWDELALGDMLIFGCSDGRLGTYTRNPVIEFSLGFIIGGVVIVLGCVYMCCCHRNTPDSDRAAADPELDPTAVATDTGLDSEKQPDKQPDKQPEFDQEAGLGVSYDSVKYMSEDEKRALLTSLLSAGSTASHQPSAIMKVN